MALILAPSINIYLKTTETCNLNCKHCFTSGSQGKKIFFSPPKVIDFFKRVKSKYSWVNRARFIFHGGEPFLAPVEELYAAYNGLKDVFPETRFTMQTNLVFELTDERRKFLKDVVFEGFGTSWDYDIRFGSNTSNTNVKSKHLELWEKNVRTLVEDGHYMTLMVSITKKLIEEKEPIEIINYAHSLGFKHILFERITSDGNAKINSDIIPANAAQDEWLHKMLNQTIEHKAYEYIGNMLMSELADAYVNHVHGGNRCRTCEQSMLTVNADGTIGGCPNTSPIANWGHIDWELDASFRSAKRIETISCEIGQRNPICYSCPAFEYCNSDCNKLAWDEDETYCAAPKKIWKQMIKDNDIETYNKLILRHSVQVAHG